MRVVYLECRMGAAGDMLCAALYEVCGQKEQFLSTMNALSLPGVSFKIVPEQKCGIAGSRAVVTIHGEEEDAHTHAYDHEHAHSHGHPHGHEHAHSHEPQEAQRVHHYEHQALGGIRAKIAALPLPESVKADAIAVYTLLAEAEAHVHGAEVELVHFHEVGALDAVADIVGACLLFHLIKPDEILASPIHTGTGQVKTAHGVLPVPAPATAYLLRGIPAYSDGTLGELCTPTGAALLKHFAGRFGDMPQMVTQQIGYGMGKKEFAAANCVRAFLGERHQEVGQMERILELRCNIDDMTPEAVGFATQTVLEAGALEVYVEPVYMKKNRPGFVVVCICREGQAEQFARLLFTHTTTLGVRTVICGRYTLTRTMAEQETSFGKVRIKQAEGYGVCRCKPEYEDVAHIAKETGLPFQAVYRQILQEIGQ